MESFDVVEALAKRDGRRCRHCGTSRDLTIDHKKPKSKGGSNDLSNLRLLCWRCNTGLGNRMG